MKRKIRYKSRVRSSHGDGKLNRAKFKRLGKKVIFERGVRVFHPENIEIGDNVYIGHNTFLKGYYKNSLRIGDDSWVGQNCFLHAGGGITICRAVGIGPGVQILSHQHIEDSDLSKPLLFCKQEYKEVVIEDGCDIGMGSILLPGVTIGCASIVGAGSVVTKDVPAYSVVVGNPARILRKRKFYKK